MSPINNDRFGTEFFSVFHRIMKDEVRRIPPEDVIEGQLSYPEIQAVKKLNQIDERTDYTL